MTKLAICIPTYNRSEIIEELIVRFGKIYAEFGFDLYIYDSSEGDETEQIVTAFQSDNPHIYYKRIDSNVHSNMKVYLIYNDFIAEDYAYVWVCNDSIRWSTQVLTDVKENINKGYDLIIVNYRDLDNLGNREYTDRIEFFRDAGWHLTLYGATIVRVSTVLSGVDWEYLVKMYCVPDRINFSHLCLYFEQLLKMNNVRILHLSYTFSHCTSTPLKEVPGWYSFTIDAFCAFFPSAIMALPRAYDCYKDTIIKKNGVYSGMMKGNYLMWLRAKGFFCIGDFIKYFSMWNKVSSLNIAIIFLIAILPRNFVTWLLERKSTWYKMRREINRFYEKYPHLYIYGCGGDGFSLAQYLDDHGIEYKGFVVSDITSEKKSLRKHQVCQYTSDIFDDDKAGIFLALNPKNYREVINQFKNPEYRKRVLSRYDVKGLDKE